MEFNEDFNAIRNESTNSILTNVFFRMFLGLIASAITAFYTYSSGLYISAIENGNMMFFAIAEIIIVLAFSLLFRKLSPTMVTILFFAYAFINGFTLSIIFAVYEVQTITYAFLSTAGLFGILAFLGYKTEKDISNWGTILLVALLVGTILTIFNLFIGSTMLDIVLDWAILFIFFGLTVYDMNKIKEMQEMAIYSEEKIYIYGAMELYLDFINIFLRILSLLGRRRK